MTNMLARLQERIADRRLTDPTESYVAALFARGLPRIAQKLGEEAIETVVAALGGDRGALTSEAADLLFHLLVLLEAGGVRLDDVLAELDRRDGVSGLAEKAARADAPGAAEPPMAPAGRPVLVRADGGPPRRLIRRG